MRLATNGRALVGRKAQRLAWQIILAASALLALGCACDCQRTQGEYLNVVRLRGDGVILIFKAAAMEKLFGKEWQKKHIFYRTIGWYGGVPYRETWFDGDMTPVPQGALPFLSLAEEAVSSKGMTQIIAFYSLNDKELVQVKLQDPSFSLLVHMKKEMKERTDCILPSGYLKWP